MNNNLLSLHYEQFHRVRNKSGTVAIPERLTFIKNEVGTGKKIIELGCRYGDVISQFYQNNIVVGVDIDRNALSVCQERYKVETKVVDLNEVLPFNDMSFDVVVITEVLEHLPYPDITLKEANRILKEGGKIIGSVPNGTKLRNRLRFLLSGTVETDPTHLQHFSTQNIKRNLEKYFNRVEVQPISGKYIYLSPKLFSNYLLFKGFK